MNDGVKDWLMDEEEMNQKDKLRKQEMHECMVGLMVEGMHG